MRIADLELAVMSLFLASGMTYGLDHAVARLAPQAVKILWRRALTMGPAVRRPDIQKQEPPPPPEPPPAPPPASRRQGLAPAAKSAPSRSVESPRDPVPEGRRLYLQPGRGPVAHLPTAKTMSTTPFLFAQAPAQARNYAPPIARSKIRRYEFGPPGSGVRPGRAGQPPQAESPAQAREICSGTGLSCRIKGLGDRGLREPEVKPRTDLPPGRPEGVCKVRLFVDRYGNVERTELIDATTPEIGTACEEAIRQWKFKPAKEPGRAQRALEDGTVELRFTAGTP